MEVFIFILIAVAVGAIAFAAWYFSKEQRIKRALRKAPRLTVGDFAEGTEAKLVGAVRLLDEFSSPLSGRACAQYHVKVEQLRSTGKSSHWRTIIEEERSVTFVLDDGTGRAVVEAENAHFAVVKDARFRSGTFKDADPVLERFLANHGTKSTGLLGFNKKLRYKEGVIEEGEQVAVYGRGVWEKDDSGKRQLVIRRPHEGPLLVSDDPSTL